MEKSYIQTGAERIACVDSGQGPPVLFIHGFPTSSHLWNGIIERLGGEIRCIAPDLMGLGDTEIAADSDLTMPGQAKMLVALMDGLGIDRFSIVAHDQGGAAAQIIATQYPDRVSKLALMDVVCYDNWPVPGVKFLQKLARLPGSTWLFGSPTVRSAANGLGMGLAAGFHDKSKLTAQITGEFTRTVMSSRERVERYKRFLLAGNGRYTMEISADLKKISASTLIIWAEKDPFIGVEWGKRLAGDIPGAEGPVVVPGCGHFLQWEKPGEVSDLLRNWI